MSFEKKPVFSKKQLSLIAKIAFLEAVAISIAIPSIQSTGEIPATIPKFGTWTNFPSGASFLDKNELFFNQTYRKVVDFPTGSFQTQIELTASCVKPSNTVGANLQLEYAEINPATGLNMTNFVVFTFEQVFIDNSVGSPCPGNLFSGENPFPDTANNNDHFFLFRVVGAGGGGIGDNPRLESVSIILFTLRRPLTVLFQTATLTNIDFSFQLTEFFSGTFDVIFDWLATNSTVTNSKITQHGENTCIGGTAVAGCTVVVTFPIAFTTQPHVTSSLSNLNLHGAPNPQIPIGSYTLFQTFLN